MPRQQPKHQCEPALQQLIGWWVCWWPSEEAGVGVSEAEEHGGDEGGGGGGPAAD